jgi:protein SCO1/2
MFRNGQRPPRYAFLILAAAVGVAIGIGAALSRGSHTPAGEQPSQPLAAQATWPAGAKRAPSFSLVDQHGHTSSLRGLHGHPVLLTFLDSRCKRECPIEGRVLRDVQRKLKGTGAVTAVVSVDPWDDTPASAIAFAHKSRWEGTWYWLLGSRARLAPVWRAYSIGVRRERGDIAHSVALYLIDARGYMRAGYLFPFSPSAVVRDVRSVTATS